MKKCNKCKKTKPINKYGKNLSKKDNISNWCLECSRKICKQYKRTKEGVCSTIFNSQVLSSKKRNHPSPSYTKEEFKKWLLGQDQFTTMYNNWVNSNYQKKLKPSVDRNKNHLPYTVENITLMTWDENHKKYMKDLLDGRETHPSNPQKIVCKLDKNGVVLCEYFSIRQASRELNINPSNIVSVCKGKRNIAGGYKWKYKSL